MSARVDTGAIRRAHSDPARLVSELGLRIGGRTARGLLVGCPRPDHADSTASCHVYRAADGTVAVRCHGCQWSADAIGLVAEVRGLDFRGACRELGAIVTTGEFMPPAAYVATAPPQAVSDDDAHRAYEAVLEASPLAARADVCEYLASRGVLEEARRAGWGALPRDLRAVRDAVVAATSLEVWRACGLATDDGESVRAPRHVIVIPYRAPGVDGAIVTLQRRRIDAGDPRYVFPLGRSAPRWPFGGEDIELTDEDTAIVYCEGAIDALTLRRCYRADGLNRVVLSIPSVSTWRPEWARLAVGRLAIVATDADGPGEQCAERMAVDLYAAGARSVQRATPATAAKDWTAQEAHAS